MFLTGCGMDLSPKYIAYKALEFGYIDESDLKKLQTKEDRKYFKYVVGDEIYQEVLEKLGIKELVYRLDGEEEVMNI